MMDNTLEILAQEEHNSRSMLHMTSYENQMSATARSFLSSDLGNRYHLGTPDTYNGYDTSVEISGFNCRALPHLHQLELSACQAARTMFDARHVELRPVSGVHAMLTTIASMTKPGDIIYSIAPEDGGHFATKHVAETLGRVSGYLAWDNELLNIDIKATKEMFQQDAPAMVFLDHGTPLFNLPVSDLKEIIPHECLLVYDASHTLGLIAGGCFQNPLSEGADILQGNTHKTFPGPQKAMVLFKDQALGARYSDCVSNGLVSSQHTHHTIALCITILEMERFGKEYAADMLSNAKCLGNNLLSRNIGLVSCRGTYTTSHELLIDAGWHDNHLNAADRLFESNISVNGRIAFSRPTIRLGVQEITRRGLKNRQMVQIAELLDWCLSASRSKEYVKSRVAELTSEFQTIHYSFDDLKAAVPERTKEYAL